MALGNCRFCASFLEDNRGRGGEDATAAVALAQGTFKSWNSRAF